VNWVDISSSHPVIWTNRKGKICLQECEFRSRISNKEEQNWSRLKRNYCRYYVHTYIHIYLYKQMINTVWVKDYISPNSMVQWFYWKVCSYLPRKKISLFHYIWDFVIICSRPCLEPVESSAGFQTTTCLCSISIGLPSSCLLTRFSRATSPTHRISP
jgi:hypothetical protein